MKKFFIIAIVLISLFVLVSCTSNENDYHGYWVSDAYTEGEYNRVTELNIYEGGTGKGTAKDIDTGKVLYSGPFNWTVTKEGILNAGELGFKFDPNDSSKNTLISVDGKIILHKKG